MTEPAGEPGVGPIVLVGFMASGKSTVARRLARRLGRAVIDLDDEVEEYAGRPIEELFARGGESTFRQLEAQATRESPARDDVVIATGGGWMARPELRERWPNAIHVWLRVSPREAMRRIGDRIRSRPMIDPADPEGSIRRLLESREPAYRRAEIHVETDGKTPERVVEEIESALRSRTA